MFGGVNGVKNCYGKKGKPRYLISLSSLPILIAIDWCQKKYCFGWSEAKRTWRMWREKRRIDSYLRRIRDRTEQDEVMRTDRHSEPYLTFLSFFRESIQSKDDQIHSATTNLTAKYSDLLFPYRNLFDSPSLPAQTRGKVEIVKWLEGSPATIRWQYSWKKSTSCTRRGLWHTVLSGTTFFISSSCSRFFMEIDKLQKQESGLSPCIRCSKSLFCCLIEQQS